MKAIEVATFGGPEQLILLDKPLPEPGPGQVLIEVKAAGINFADLRAREGRYPRGPQPPFIPGNEAAGIVAALGQGVTAPAAGTRVMAFLTGGFSQIVLADSGILSAGDQHSSWVVHRQFEETAELFDIRKLNLGLPHHRQLLPRSVDAGFVERSDVVNGGDIVRNEHMGAIGQGIARLRVQPQHGLPAEVMETVNGEHDALEGHGYGRAGGIGVVRFAAHLVAMDLDAKRAADLAGGAAEGNRIARASYGLHGKTRLAEPGNHLVYVGSTYSEAVRVLLRSQPAMVIRRRGILLLRQ